MSRRPPLDDAVARTRVAVRRALQETDDALVLVALSGGADSLALAAATAFEARRAPWRAGAVIIDHGLQSGSRGVAARAAEAATTLGLDPVLVRRVEVSTAGDGPEAAARDARYNGFAKAAAETGAAVILTAHTRDDQAEQVLLGLARGSGTRSLAGIPPARLLTPEPVAQTLEPVERVPELAEGLEPVESTFELVERVCEPVGPVPELVERVCEPVAPVPELVEGPEPLEGQTAPVVLRPFLDQSLDISRETTERACAALGLQPWHDPHNDDLAYARVRVRQRVLPVLERELGPRVASALARTAEINREDAEALDDIAAITASNILARGERAEGSVRVRLSDLSELAPAVRHRVIRRICAQELGTRLTREHTLAVASLVTGSRGRGPAFVPGVRAQREGDMLLLEVQRGSPRAN